MVWIGGCPVHPDLQTLSVLLMYMLRSVSRTLTTRIVQSGSESKSGSTTPMLRLADHSSSDDKRERRMEGGHPTTRLAESSAIHGPSLPIHLADRPKEVHERLPEAQTRFIFIKPFKFIIVLCIVPNVVSIQVQLRVHPRAF